MVLAKSPCKLFFKRRTRKIIERYNYYRNGETSLMVGKEQIQEKNLLNNLNNNLENEYFTLDINSNGKLNIKITDGWESLYYYQKSEIPVLEISFGTDVSEIITEIRLK